VTVTTSSRIQCIDQSNHGEKTEQVSQMAAIYACAQLTIVAAEGENPDHGLLHISRKPDPLLVSASLNLLQFVPFPDQSEAVAALGTSIWASRAWTFQECYFSRRRLFFTGDQVVYICNDENDRRMPAGWSPSQDRSVLISQDNCAQAIRIIRAYSDRQLSYESDALAAIVSTLDALRGDTMQHVWAVPLRNQEPLLFWSHDEPCTRRYGFPSWSPIAWTGKLNWYTLETTEAWAVELLTHPESIDDKFRSVPHNIGDYEDLPRFLKITAHMARMRLLKAPVLGGDGAFLDFANQRLFLSFPLDYNVDIILQPNWDVDPCTLDPHNPIIGILEGPPKWNQALVSDQKILLTQRRGSFYERVGFLRLVLTSILHSCSGVDDQYFRFFHKDDVRLSRVHASHGDGKTADFDILERRNCSLFFVQDSIVLG
jgi:hypothetical protein